MAIGYFIAPYVRRDTGPHVGRYCVMDDYTQQIAADGGSWAESEALGNVAIVKVSASTATLSNIAADASIMRIPLTLLDDTLASLSNAQRNAIRNKLLAMGYTTSEITNRFPNIAQATLGDVLRFALSRRLKPRYDSATDSIICDGDLQGCTPIELIDAMVK